MKFDLSRALIIARREYLTTVRRKAFVLSLLLTPAILYFTTFVSGKLAGDDARARMREGRIVALVDSSGVFAQAPHEYSWRASAASPGPGTRSLVAVAGDDGPSVTVKAEVRPFASQSVALDSLGAGTVNSVVVVAADYLRTGHIRRYEHDTRALTSSADDGPMRAWLTRSLLGGADSARVERAVALRRPLDLYVPARTGGFQLKDDRRELFGFFLPFVIGFMMGMSIMSGGQYLLTGVAEEKESRILESLLTTVTPNDLMLGKLIGLGGAGLTLVGFWIVLGLGATGGTLALLKIELPMELLAIGLLYFVFGYLFYGSLMTGIGAISNNLRESQQFAVIFSLMNFFPFYVLVKILNSPNSGVAVGMSLFPPTAATTMMMRLAASSVTGAVIPMWQVAASLGLLAVSAAIVLLLAAKIFRLGLLLYGKTPNLPEILAILRQK